MRFNLSDDQREIKSTARDLLASRGVFERLRELDRDPRAGDAALWAEMCELGWPGVATSEEDGGLGLGLVELVVIAEELGFAMAGTPFLPSAAAALVIDAAGSPDQRAMWLPRLAGGEATGCLQLVRDGVPEMTPYEDADVTVIVDDAGAHLLSRDEAVVEPVETIDITRGYAFVSGAGESLPGDAAPGVARAAVVVAAELAGIAQHALDITVAYVKERKQFGTPIGAFQAVAHRCADMLKYTEGARSVTWYAAWASDSAPDELDSAASVAKVYASDAGRRVTADAIQNHGGIGFTWEADPHWMFKRAQLDAAVFGNARAHRAALTRLAGRELSVGGVSGA